MEEEFNRVYTQVASIIKRFMNTSKYNHNPLPVQLEHANTFGKELTEIITVNHDDDYDDGYNDIENQYYEELIIHNIIFDKDKKYYVGEDENGRGNNTVYIENPNYKGEIQYKKCRRNFVFKNKHAFVKVGNWIC